MQSNGISATMLFHLKLRSTLAAIVRATIVFGLCALPTSVVALDGSNTVEDSSGLETAGYSFRIDDRFVSIYLFHWYTTDDGQKSGPWPPLNGRASWTGEAEQWVPLIKQIMAANIDIIFVHLIDSYDEQRRNLFRALAMLRREGYDVPKIAPFFDPEVTWYNEPVLDLSIETGKRALADQYIRFFRQYFEEQPDRFAVDFLAQIDGRIVLSVWHVHLRMTNLHALSRLDLEQLLAAEFGATCPEFDRGVYLITQHGDADRVFSFGDEQVHQFDDVYDYVQFTEHRGVATAQIKPGYWDQNIRTPGSFLPRRGGVEYMNAWARIDRDDIRHVYIESFNEYDEGTGIYAADVDQSPVVFESAPDITDSWSNADDPFEYIRQTADAARHFNDRPDHAVSFLAHDFPSRLGKGQSCQAGVVIRNEGDLPWKNGVKLRLWWSESDEWPFHFGHMVANRTRFASDSGSCEVKPAGCEYR